jgi:hypothetical protein
MGKRGRKAGKERKGYFYEKEEQAVIDYVSSDDKNEKNKIYAEFLQPAFTKMIESIIRRYNLYLPDELFQETFDDTLSFLLTKIEHFKPESGFKAYSYCGTICKNYLILKIKQYNNNLIRNDRYEIVQNDIDDNVKFSYSTDNDQIQFLTELLESITQEISLMLESKDVFRLNENEIKVGNALVILLNNWGDLFARMGSNKFNKSSILMFIKELTLLSTPEIRLAMKKYKNAYQNIRKKALDDIYY